MVGKGVLACCTTSLRKWSINGRRLVEVVSYLVLISLLKEMLGLFLCVVVIWRNDPLANLLLIGAQTKKRCLAEDHRDVSTRARPKKWQRKTTNIRNSLFPAHQSQTKWFLSETGELGTKNYDENPVRIASKLSTNTNIRMQLISVKFANNTNS